MALRLTTNDINSGQVDQQVECISSRAREPRNMALALRQKHLDEKLQIKDQPHQVFIGMQGRVPGPGPGRSRGFEALIPQGRRTAAGKGQVVLQLPGLSNCEGSPILILKECLVCSSRQDRQTPCSDWLS